MQNMHIQVVTGIILIHGYFRRIIFKELSATFAQLEERSNWKRHKLYSVNSNVYIRRTSSMIILSINVCN